MVWQRWLSWQAKILISTQSTCTYIAVVCTYIVGMLSSNECVMVHFWSVSRLLRSSSTFATRRSTVHPSTSNSASMATQPHADDPELAAVLPGPSQDTVADTHQSAAEQEHEVSKREHDIVHTLPVVVLLTLPPPAQPSETNPGGIEAAHVTADVGHQATSPARAVAAAAAATQDSAVDGRLGAAGAAPLVVQWGASSFDQPAGLAATARASDSDEVRACQQQAHTYTHLDTHSTPHLTSSTSTPTTTPPARRVSSHTIACSANLQRCCSPTLPQHPLPFILVNSTSSIAQQ